MWALDYKAPDEYTCVQGDFSDLLDAYPEKHLFCSKEETEKYGRIYSDVDKDLRTIYAVRYDEEKKTAEVVSGKKSELIAMGFASDDLMLWEEEAQLHKERVKKQKHSGAVRWRLDYRAPGDYSIESVEREFMWEKYRGGHLFYSQKEAEDYAGLLSDIDRDLVTIYKVIHNREHGTADIIGGTKSELIAMGYEAPFCYTESAAQMSKKSFELNMRSRIRKKAENLSGK